jgi:cardiolipin synthase
VRLLAAALPRGVADPGFAELLHRIDDGPILGGNEVRLYFRGEKAFLAMHEAIREATREVLLESYILKDDGTGRRFADALAAAVARGVRVCVLADFFGSYATHARFWTRMRKKGIEVRLFNPIFPHVFLQPFRDHRKILVVDRRVAFTGGMNIGDEYGSSRRSRVGPWRDTHARVEGTTAWEMATVFGEAWHRAGGSPMRFEPLERNPSTPVRVLTLDARPGRGHGETAAALEAIAAASRRTLWITNAYFAPKRRAVNLLGDAARRGVDVRVLLPGRTDVPLVRHAGHGYFADLLDRGVRVFEYGAAILHAKTAVADEIVSFVGSSNLDFRSFHFNGECNWVIFDAEVGRAFAAAFEDDLTRSVEITRAGWKRRPWHAAGDALARCLAPLL